jgi:hypothetical protein
MSTPGRSGRKDGAGEGRTAMAILSVQEKPVAAYSAPKTNAHARSTVARLRVSGAKWA